MTEIHILSETKEFLSHELKNLRSQGENEKSLEVINDHLRSVLTNISDPSNVENITFSDDISPMISVILDLLVYEKLTPIVLILIMKLSDTYQSQFEDEIVDYFDDLILSCSTKTEKHQLLIRLGELFPIVTNACFRVWRMEEFVNLIANEVSIVLNFNDLNTSQDRIFDLLQLLSVSCFHDKLRDLIAQHFVLLPLKVLKLTGGGDRVTLLHSLSALIIVKVWNSLKAEFLEKHKDFLTAELISETLINGVLNSDVSNTDSDSQLLEQTSVEGLAYLSLNVKVKQRLRHDDNLISALFDNLETISGKTKQLIYGYLSILSNITSYNKVLTKSQESMQFLKNYANVNHQSGKRQEMEKDDDEDIFKFIETSLTKFKVIDFLSSLLKYKDINISQSRGLQTQIIKLIYNYSYVSKTRVECVKQGGLSIILTYLVNTSNELSYKKGYITSSKPSITFEKETRHVAIQALSKLLMSNNPNLIFKKFEIMTPVPFLSEILFEYNSYTNGTKYGDDFVSPLKDCEISSVDVFECFIALTNLSSVDSKEVKQVIVNITLTTVIDLLLVADTQIQRALLQLLGNLIENPTCCQRFFDWDPQSPKGPSYKNFIILTKLMDSVDVESQIAVLNIFANSTQFEMISLMLIQSVDFIKHVLNLLKDQHEEEDLMVRCFYILINICGIAQASKKELLDSLPRKQEIKSSVLGVIKTHRTADLVEMGGELCRLL